MPIPKSVTVVVYGGRCFKAKKGEGTPLAWVVFGFGKNKCCTAQVRDINPTWNEENNFTITDPKAPLKLTVKDKDDTLGQIQIPLTDIPHEEHTFKWIPLGPHRRNLHPSGELCIDCWIVDYKDGETLKKDSNFLKLKHKLNLKPLSYDGKRKGSLQSGAMSMKGSISVEDLSRNQYKSKTLSAIQKPDFTLSSGLSRATSVYLKKPEPSSPVQKPPVSVSSSPTTKSPVLPEIKLITPISGPCSGGTLVQIMGKNLGKSKDDVKILTVAGSDCISTLEYHSSDKLMCTTTPGKGVGPVFLTTASGGSCWSRVEFEFEAKGREDNTDGKSIIKSSPDKKQLTVNNDKKPPNGRKFSLSSKIQEKRGSTQELRKEVDELSNEVKELKMENTELKEYLDRLLLYVMEKYPEALESRRFHR